MSRNFAKIRFAATSILKFIYQAYTAHVKNAQMSVKYIISNMLSFVMTRALAMRYPLASVYYYNGNVSCIRLRRRSARVRRADLGGLI